MCVLVQVSCPSGQLKVSDCSSTSDIVCTNSDGPTTAPSAAPTSSPSASPSPAPSAAPTIAVKPGCKSGFHWSASRGKCTKGCDNAPLIEVSSPLAGIPGSKVTLTLLGPLEYDGEIEVECHWWYEAKRVHLSPAQSVGGNVTKVTCTVPLRDEGVPVGGTCRLAIAARPLALDEAPSSCSSSGGMYPTDPLNFAPFTYSLAELDCTFEQRVILNRPSTQNLVPGDTLQIFNSNNRGGDNRPTDELEAACTWWTDVPATLSRRLSSPLMADVHTGRPESVFQANQLAFVDTNRNVHCKVPPRASAVANVKAPQEGDPVFVTVALWYADGRRTDVCWSGLGLGGKPTVSPGGQFLSLKYPVPPPGARPSTISSAGGDTVVLYNTEAFGDGTLDDIISVVLAGIHASHVNVVSAQEIRVVAGSLDRLGSASTRPDPRQTEDYTLEGQVVVSSKSKGTTVVCYLLLIFSVFFFALC